MYSHWWNREASLIKLVWLFWTLVHLIKGQGQETTNAFTEVNLPGEPLNPDDFEAAQRYNQALESGLITEPDDVDDDDEDDEDSSVEMMPRDQLLFSTDTWDEGVIPYRLSKEFTEKQRRIIARAISEYQPRTCLVFTPRTVEKDFVDIAKGETRECSSAVGRIGGPQRMELGPRCFKNKRTIVHELLHAAGFSHEHNRLDRDKYVKIHFNRIKPGQEPQFFINPKAHNTLTPYDYGSILHYTARSFCRRPCTGVVIEKLNMSDTTRLGQQKLSPRDIERTNILYNCTSRVNSTLTNVLGGTTGSVVSKFPPLLGQNQRKLQGCRDYDESCGLARNLDCERSTWTKFNCRKSCGNCNETSNCEDYHSKCNDWQRRGECHRRSEYMLIYCQRACGACS